MDKFYLDTSIWIDYYENRSDRFRQIGEWALQFLKIVIKNNWIVIYSELITYELLKIFSQEEIIKIFSILADRGLLKEVNINYIQRKEAAILSKEINVPFGDALHAVLARDNKAILITRDKHFLELLDIAYVKKPEDLI